MTCTHPDACAVETAPCGQAQEWYCETIGGCGGYFTITKPHAVQHFTLHADGCEYRKRGIPASWCKCESLRVAGCVDCDKEFPVGTVSGPGVDVYA